MVFSLCARSHIATENNLKNSDKIDHKKLPSWHLIVGLIYISSYIELRHEKNNVLVSDLVRHKPGYTATEDG